MFERQVIVRKRLRLDALGRIDDQERTLARRERPRDLVGKIDVAGRIDKIQAIELAVSRAIFQRHRMHANRDAALALEVHRVQRLIFKLARTQGARDFHQPVRKRRLAMIDVRDDAKVADVARNVDPVRPLGFQRQGVRYCIGMQALPTSAPSAGRIEQLQYEKHDEKGQIEAAERWNDATHRGEHRLDQSRQIVYTAPAPEIREPRDHGIGEQQKRINRRRYRPARSPGCT